MVAVTFDADDVNEILNWYHQNGETLVDKSYWFIKQLFPGEAEEVLFDKARLTAVFCIAVKQKGLSLETVDWNAMIVEDKIETVREILDEYDYWQECQLGLHPE